MFRAERSREGHVMMTKHWFEQRSKLDSQTYVMLNNLLTQYIFI